MPLLEKATFHHGTEDEVEAEFGSQEKATFHHGTEDEVEAELGNQDRTQESASFECPCPMIPGMNMSESTHRTG
eukprot:CAMPEP_0117761034 /NCGR_PEP_ID=MMETSP0947-20121206/17015_1 /TAXON_ID=44440 /ORGANISM="Chattonella subsalsa, Strain CCMP2191" /LENGTH=73 /DNA_ID=CAMNT_0005581899 /DNA_START=108 /DNA_END=329 /DNA_ORIENTATION=+